MDGYTIHSVDPNDLPNKQHVISFNIKSPKYNRRGEIVGVKARAGITANINIDHSIILAITPYSFHNDTTLNIKNNIAASNLSQREKACLSLYHDGMTAKQTANALNVSYRTIEKHFENIKRKLNVKYKDELIDYLLNDWQS